MHCKTADYIFWGTKKHCQILHFMKYDIKYSFSCCGKPVLQSAAYYQFINAVSLSRKSPLPRREGSWEGGKQGFAVSRIFHPPPAPP
jgi:hypothetical protein